MVVVLIGIKLKQDEGNSIHLSLLRLSFMLVTQIFVRWLFKVSVVQYMTSVPLCPMTVMREEARSVDINRFYMAYLHITNLWQEIPEILMPLCLSQNQFLLHNSMPCLQLVIQYIFFLVSLKLPDNGDCHINLFFISSPVPYTQWWKVQ